MFIDCVVGVCVRLIVFLVWVVCVWLIVRRLNGVVNICWFRGFCGGDLFFCSGVSFLYSFVLIFKINDFVVVRYVWRV